MLTTNNEKNFLETFLSYLNDNFNYCILRNYEEYPEKMGNDIDILVEENDINNLLINLEKYFVENKLLYKIKAKNKSFLSIICFYESFNKTIETIHIDIWIKIEWRGIEWINTKYILKNKIKYKNFYVPCNGCEVAITVFKELIVNGIVKEKYYNPLTSKIINDKSNFINSLYNSMGKYVYIAYDLISNSNYKELNNQQKKIRNILRSKFLIRYIINTIKKACQKINNIFFPKGKLVAFVGPDGSGKTTFIDLSEKHFKELFNGVKRYHIRFNILPELKTGRGISSMGGKVNKDTSSKYEKRSLISKLASWFVVLYYTFEFFIGRLPLRKYKIKNYIVFYDRYYYDFFVQPTSRELIYKFRKLLLFFVKKPDIVIHLDADANIVYKRKQELSVKEIEKQNSILNKLFNNSKNVFRVNTDNKSISEIDKEIFNILYKEL